VGTLIVFTGFCLLSRLDISIRHFSIPLVLLILLLAPLPRMIERLHYSKPNGARFVGALAAVLTVSCLFTGVKTYPYYFPYLNALSFGRPGYVLVNDSNLDWNQSLPEVKIFAEQHGLRSIDLDEYGFTDASVDVPQSKIWDCQRPTPADAGQWAAISANMIMEATTAHGYCSMSICPLPAAACMRCTCLIIFQRQAARAVRHAPPSFANLLGRPSIYGIFS
jgi:hypothetical protein